MRGLLGRLRAAGAGAPDPEPHSRWVVVDVETSGLDPATAQLLAIAGVGVRVDWDGGHLDIVPGDSIEIGVRPQQVVRDPGNVLVHGIGYQRQAQGLPLPQALALWHDFTQSAPLLAFHAWFDRALLERHRVLAWGPDAAGGDAGQGWVDIARLCAVLRSGPQGGDLDDWLARLGIECPARHQAAADCLAECELLQRVWPQLLRELGRDRSWAGLQRLERAGRWLGR